MSKGNSRTKTIYYLGLLSLLFLLWAYIYPTHPFPGGIDEMNYLNLANTFVYYGNFKTLIHPLSAWGIYPFSPVPGTSILLGNGMLLTRINHLDIVMIYNYILGTLAILSMFALLFKIKKDFRFAMVGTFIFIFTPRLMEFFLFSLGARGLFHMMTPTFILLAIMYIQNKDEKKYLWLAIVTFFTISTIHLNFLFLIPFIYAMGVSILLINMKFQRHLRKLKSPILNKLVNSRFSKTLFWISVVTVIFLSLLAIAEFVPSHKFNLRILEETGFFKGGSNMEIMANVGVSMLGGSSFGVLMFGTLGFLAAFTIKRKEPVEYLLIIAAIASIPLALTSFYFRPFVVLYTSIFAAYGFIWIVKQNIPFKKIVVPILVIVMIIGSFAFINSRLPKGYGARDVSSRQPEPLHRHLDYYINYETYNAGLHLKYNLREYERYASYKRPFENNRLEVISTRALYGKYYSIHEAENFFSSDEWYVIRKRSLEITDPYMSIPHESIIYPELFVQNLDRMNELAVEHNITIVHTHPDEPLRDMNIFILNNNRYKIYENEENIFWRF